MIAYEKHSESSQDNTLKRKDHFDELKEKQREAQKDFHQKLFSELQKEVGGEMRSSAVAKALGTKFEVKAKPISHSKSTGQVKNKKNNVIITALRFMMQPTSRLGACLHPARVPT